ncbi:ABC transporter permease [Helicobacter aurati]|uniref:ABC transporter permease n=1 Tax=Helicobacter aurati TaxID=137778 RepID=A0A3D8J158_9HELI|nr:ABC transporter permease [Helicobacter aurati]RDU70511.1 ABC transporter permease [Helicobacter aurati]
MFIVDHEAQLLCNNFTNVQVPNGTVIIEGNWDSFVKQAYINALNTQIQKYQENIHILFQQAKVGIIFMLLLKDILQTHRFNKIFLYVDNPQIMSLLPFLLSDSYQVFVNNIVYKSSTIKTKQANTLPHHLNHQIPQKNMLIRFFESLGKWCYDFYKNALAFFNFMGMFLHFFALSCLNPSNFRLNSLIYHIYEHGFKALPVGLAVSLIIGYAITLQGAYQLNSMGVPIMSVDTTAKLALREMGPFILALVIAGRSASSFTAQLGAMRLTEELAAMQVMNLNLFYFLIIPRVLALIIIMPLMVFAADAVALFGGMVAIKTSVNIGFEMYLERFYETVSIAHFWIGVVKAPVFGAIIGIVGCFRGLECKGDTQSIGRMTTISVVNAIFWIIMANAIFSFIFTRFNL